MSHEISAPPGALEFLEAYVQYGPEHAFSQRIHDMGIVQTPVVGTPERLQAHCGPKLDIMITRNQYEKGSGWAELEKAILAGVCT